MLSQVPGFAYKLNLLAPLGPSTEQPDPWRSTTFSPGIWCSGLRGSPLSEYLVCDSDPETRREGDRNGLDDVCGMHSIFILPVIFPAMGSTA